MYKCTEFEFAGPVNHTNHTDENITQKNEQPLMHTHYSKSLNAGFEQNVGLVG